MPTINDFFLLFWDEKKVPEATFDEKLFVELDEHFCDSVAILLSINVHNFAQIIRLPQTKLLFNGIFQTLLFTKDNVQKVQTAILLHLGEFAINSAISKRFELLSKEGVIAYEVSQKLISLISLIQEKKSEKISLHVKTSPKEENYYKTSKSKLLTAIDNLSQSVESTTLLGKLTNIPQKLENQSFSIGITGVMNAGKSTMLNALLGKKVLGTSIIPETANLTLIKYAKEPYAVVNFWSAKEWQKIEESATSLKSIEAFVSGTKHHFGENFATFITEKGKKQTIKEQDLSLYTSAKHSDKKCNLVKSVELFTDLKFVKEGVVIVDTPGLDDPVIQREEITLEYLEQCDLLIHLMNVAQACTQKDIDFIIDALLYRNIAQLLIVLTRIDAVSEEALQEVIAYTKMSIEVKLKEQNKASKLDEIIAKIAFIPLSGKLALMHKTGKKEEALALGYDLQRTGFPLLEAYLEDVLFGEHSQKANLIISANQKEIEQIAILAKDSLENERRFLSISREEMEKEVALYEEEKKSVMTFLSLIKSTIVQSKEEMQDYFCVLEKFATHKAEALHVEIKRRVLDDVNYEFSKNKQLPKSERIAYIVEMGIKDGLVDLVRDYRYEFQKKMHNALSYMETKYGEFKAKSEENIFDTKAFFEEHFGGLFVFKNSSILVQHINEAIKKYGKSEPNKLSQTLDELLRAEFLVIKELLHVRLKNVNHKLLDTFIILCETPAKSIEEAINTKEEMLSNALLRINDQSFARQNRMDEIEEKLRVIRIVLEELK